jgi:hypothetical protein
MVLVYTLIRCMDALLQNLFFSFVNNLLFTPDSNCVLLFQLVVCEYIWSVVTIHDGILFVVSFAVELKL